MRKLVILLGIAFLFLVILSISSAQYEKIDNQVARGVEDSGQVKVIVELANLNSISNEDIESNYKNSVSIEVDKHELEELEDNPRVLRIRESKELKLSLYDAVNITNATLSWKLQQNGINLTGEGETICIIDSGVNYTHPDLGGCLGAGCKVIAGYDFNSGASEDEDPMDYNGHGTHVAGIVAANGTVRGIAPGAKIVSVKVFSDAGAGGNQITLANAIQWCVDNSSRFNISVITMSLGFIENSTGYCDSDSDWSEIKTAVNNAVAKNISVTIASGNDGNFTAVNPPACLQNATPVGATTKTDTIASYSNRYNLSMIFAPGSDIYSTYSPGYTTLTGTSMATPMAAGAFAIVREFYRLQNNTILTPIQIRTKLNSSGFVFRDSSSGLNFSRINIYQTILDLDESNPGISLISPVNNSMNMDTNQIFSCNASDFQLKNLTIEVWNSTSLMFSNFTNITGIFNSSSWNVSNLAHTNYSWNCFSCDKKNNCGLTKNFSLIISRLSVSLISPINNNITRGNLSFSCNATSNTTLTNLTFYLYYGSSIYNQTVNVTGLENSSVFYANFSNAGQYKWGCAAYNNLSDFWISENYTVTYNITDVDAVCSNCGGGGSSGGGGGSSPAVVQTKEEEKKTYIAGDIKEGYSKTLNLGDNLIFNVNSERHSLKVGGVFSSSIVVEIYSNVFSLELKPGEEIKLDLNSDWINDLLIKLNSLNNKTAYLTVKEIHEQISKPIDEINQTANIQAAVTGRNYISTTSFAIILILVIAMAAYLVVKDIKRIRLKKLRKQINGN